MAAPHSPSAWMELALSLAATAASFDEVPVGAVLVKDNRVIGTGFNRKEAESCVTQHAEIIAIEHASQNLSNWRLIDCDLYVTLEPCAMCAGALYQARVRHVYYGAKDPKGGALGSVFSLHEEPRLNHQLVVTAGIEQERCSQILSDYFQAKRAR